MCYVGRLRSRLLNILLNNDEGDSDDGNKEKKAKGKEKKNEKETTESGKKPPTTSPSSLVASSTITARTMRLTFDGIAGDTGKGKASIDADKPSLPNKQLPKV